MANAEMLFIFSLLVLALPEVLLLSWVVIHPVSLMNS